MQKCYHGDVDGDACYYQIIQNEYNLMTICEMQDFDENENDQDEFCKNSQGEIHCFETEEMAVIKLNEWFEPYMIVEEYCNNPVNVNLIRE